MKTGQGEKSIGRWKRGLPLALIACLALGYLAYLHFVDGVPLIGLWLTPDQQGRYFFERGDYRRASERFEDPLWKGIACYTRGDFAAAVEEFARVETPEGHFDLGNAAARSGLLEEAAKSYEEALRLKPGYKEAKENLDLLLSLIHKKKSREKKKDDEGPEGQQPTYSPDEITVDEKGKKGARGEIEQRELTAGQIEDLWMRRLQTTPSGFLRMKFAVQAEEAASPAKKQDRSKGGK